tara:strand:- start:1065 stop:1364 length:300 start_codon:yes stop_codon:yes gene_type:complete
MSEYWKHIIEIEKVKKETDELMMKKIDHYEKELALVREQAQIDTLEKDRRITDLLNINEEHKKINGDLRQLNNELIKDNQNLAKQVDDNINKLRKAGVI